MKGNYGHPQSEETKVRLRAAAIKQFKLRPYESAFNTFLLNAKRRELDTDITYEHFLTFVETTECIYCGATVEWPAYNVRKHQGHNLDRKDSSKGYLLNNTVVCCWPCNNMKGNHFTFAQFMEIGKLLRAWNFPGSTKGMPTYLNCVYCPSQSYLQPTSAISTMAEYHCLSKHKFWIPKETHEGH
jgi:hypothetical protein